MSLPLTERVLCELHRRLARIARSDGYYTDAGARAVRAQRHLDPDDLPALVLWGGAETVAGGAGATRSMKVTLSITVDGLIAADQETTGEQLEFLRADIKRAMLQDRGRLADEAGAIGELTYAGSDPRERETGGDAESVSLQFEARYQEGYGDPTKAR